MLRRIGKCFKFKIILRGRIVEADEVFIGGTNHNRHKSKRVKGTQGRSTKYKTPVFGMVERGGNFVAQVVNDTTAKSLVPLIKNIFALMFT